MGAGGRPRAPAHALVALTRRRTTRHGGEDGQSAFDLGFGSFCCLAVVLSPVAWPHYVFMLSLPLVIAWTIAWNRGDRAGLWLDLSAALMLSVPVTETSGIGFTVFSGLSSGLAVLRTGAILAIWGWLIRTQPETTRTHLVA